MRAMILAAGRGERMGELTAQTPKPLLQVAGHYLIEFAIASLKRAGIQEIVINVSYHRDQIKSILGDGARYGVTILYSEEAERLETGGGIVHALPLLGDEPFIVISSDIITAFPLATLPKEPQGLAHLVLVNNPVFHPDGDFGLRDSKVGLQIQPRLTFANIGIYRPDIFSACTPGFFPWKQVMFPLIESGQVTGEHYEGPWFNIGTPADLLDVNQRAREDSNLRPLASETNTLSN
jgi:MurNAc alpha-1-phosphate uridylyltransferase